MNYNLSVKGVRLGIGLYARLVRISFGNVVYVFKVIGTTGLIS
jgi:hypothetical protein